MTRKALYIHQSLSSSRRWVSQVTLQDPSSKRAGRLEPYGLASHQISMQHVPRCNAFKLQDM